MGNGQYLEFILPKAMQIVRSYVKRFLLVPIVWLGTLSFTDGNGTKTNQDDICWSLTLFRKTYTVWRADPAINVRGCSESGLSNVYPITRKDWRFKDPR